MFYLQYVKEHEEDEDEEEECGWGYFEVPLKRNGDLDFFFCFCFPLPALFVVYLAEFTASPANVCLLLCLICITCHLRVTPPLPSRSNCKCIGQVDVRSFSPVDMTPITLINDNKN